MGDLSLRLALWSYFQNLTSMSAVAGLQNLNGRLLRRFRCAVS